MLNRILIIGASGSGTTTVGKRLAKELDFSHIETDDLFWLPVDPPFSQYRNQRELDEVLKTKVIAKGTWVLSGSPCVWGDVIIDLLDLVIFLIVPTEIRIERISEREQKRFGRDIQAGGKLFEAHHNFLEWTKRYDIGDVTGRTKAMHEKWLSNLQCPVLKFENETDSNQVVKSVLNYIRNHSNEMI